MVNLQQSERVNVSLPEYEVFCLALNTMSRVESPSERLMLTIGHAWFMSSSLSSWNPTPISPFS